MAPSSILIQQCEMENGMLNIVMLLVGVLATYRVAQIVGQDTISEPFRYWITKRPIPPDGLSPQELSLFMSNNPSPKLSFLRRWLALGVTCIVCVSVWAGIGIAIILYGLTLQAVVYGLSFSGGAVVLGGWLASQNRSK